MTDTWARLGLAMAAGLGLGPPSAWSAGPVVVDGTSTTVICTGTTCGEANNYDPGLSGCVMAFGSSVPTPGPDRVFTVVRPPNSILDLRLSPAATWDPALYVTTTSDPDTLVAIPGSCVVGVDNGFKGSDEVLTGLENEGTVSDTVYVIVDSNFASGSLSCGAFDLEFAFRPRVGDVCADAYSATLGAGESVEFAGASCVHGDSVNPPECGAGYPAGGAPGRDVAHAVTLVSTTPFSIRLTPLEEWDGAILVATDCEGIDASCVASVDDAGTGGEELLPLVPILPNTTFYIFVDSSSASGNPAGCGAYELSVVTEPETPIVPLTWGALKARF